LTFDHLSAEMAADLLATHFRHKGNKAEEERVIRKAGIATEYAASQASPLLALAWLQPLMEHYRDVGMTADAERVQIESRRRGMSSGDDMKKMSHSATIPAEAVNAYLNWITEPQDLQTRLIRWALNNVNSLDEARSSLIESQPQCEFGDP
jgi:hypothetical protein